MRGHAEVTRGGYFECEYKRSYGLADTAVGGTATVHKTPMEAVPWFCGALSAQDAERALKNVGMQDGFFLLRVADGKELVLSLAYKVKHIDSFFPIDMFTGNVPTYPAEERSSSKMLYC